MGVVNGPVAIIIIGTAIIGTAGIMTMTLVNGRGIIAGVGRPRGNGLTGIGRRSYGRGNTEIGRLWDRDLDRLNRGGIETGTTDADAQQVEKVHYSIS